MEDQRTLKKSAVSTAASAAAGVSTDALTAEELLEVHFFMRLAREWDLRYEKLFRIGGVAKWYSSVGNEATTVVAATAIEAGDSLLSLHRDSGAILRYYLDVHQLAPGLLPRTDRRQPCSADSRDLLHRLACQVLGKRDGFSEGFERSFHYGHMDEGAGIAHIGMISHLGAMIPVAAGVALAFKQRGSDRVALNFIGDGGTSTGDFHEGMNMAAVLRVPLVLIIENNQYAFSTPLRQQCAVESLALRAQGYGVAGVRVNGNDPEAVWREASRAVERARNGGGPTLIEAMVGRMRGHSEGDDSIRQVPREELEGYLTADPMERFEQRLVERRTASAEHCERVKRFCADLVTASVDRAKATPDPTSLERRIYAD